MEKIRIGILGAADIAYRRFLPALQKHEGFTYIGVASQSGKRVEEFQRQYGGVVFSDYEKLLDCQEIDSVYIPLPPALHYKWGRKALEAGKHVLLEKPFTTNEEDTNMLVKIAGEKNLTVFENYMFLYHRQLEQIMKIWKENWLGNIHQISIRFGFPERQKDDFRYNKELGGGALLDCGGYTLRLATEFLDKETIRVATSSMVYQDTQVDLFGAITLEDKNGTVANLSFGMANEYKCELQIWGQKGFLETDRIFTAPEDWKPVIHITKEGKEEIIELEGDNQFYNSINQFYKCVNNKQIRGGIYKEILKQSELMEKVLEGGTYAL